MIHKKSLKKILRAFPKKSKTLSRATPDKNLTDFDHNNTPKGL
jgi:hypothetical protein